jgi:hypothetical protein
MKPLYGVDGFIILEAAKCVNEVFKCANGEIGSLLVHARDRLPWALILESACFTRAESVGTAHLVILVVEATHDIDHTLEVNARVAIPANP